MTITEQQFRAAMREHRGNVSRAAEALGISRQHAHRLIHRWGRPAPINPAKLFTPLPEEAREFDRVSHVLDSIFGELPRIESVVAAAEYGTRVHTYLEDLLHGIEPEGDAQEIAVARSAHETVAAVAGDDPVFTEVPLWSFKERVRGTADVVIVRPPEGNLDGEFVVIDLKTGSHANRHHLQQAAYCEMLEEMAAGVGYKASARAYLLYVDREAKVKLRPTASPQDRAAWHAAVVLHRWVEVKR